MPHWSWDIWIFQWLGLMLIGAGVIARALFMAARWRSRHPSGDAGIPGNMPAAVGINVARIRIGGDWAGLLVVIGVILAFMSTMWAWFLAVAIGAVLVAIMLFLWHRYHPW